MSIKQKVINSDSLGDITHQIEMALQLGWLVHPVTVNSDTNHWLAILYKEAA